MLCPECESKNTRVTCTSHTKAVTTRYSRCLDCKKRFKSIEKIVRQNYIRNHKLNKTKVCEIRANKNNLTYIELAIKYDVALSTIHKAITKKSWRNVP